MGLVPAVCSICLITVILVAGKTLAQGALEIIPLRHRTADQVLPALRPLMEPGAVLTGQGTQLIVRTSPANLAELKRALDDLDRPLRRLQISVRFDDAVDQAAQGVETSGRVTNRGSSVDVRVQERQGTATGRVDQRVQVLEGGRAFISTGRNTPVYDGSGFRETFNGFEGNSPLARAEEPR